MVEQTPSQTVVQHAALPGPYRFIIVCIFRRYGGQEKSADGRNSYVRWKGQLFTNNIDMDHDSARTRLMSKLSLLNPVG